MKMVTEQKLSVAEAARPLDVGENLLCEWREAFLARGDAAFPGHGNPAPGDDERRRLRAENARLKAERDLLRRPRRASSGRRTLGTRPGWCARRRPARSRSILTT
ncbi:MAG: transposase [Planctomycetes bacterium]|nr:transposase [Planctomycetota bacterium]